jgi:16S rRNA (adenine1518-N6/adenine1519-N6)-dimethyltransferase
MIPTRPTEVRAWLQAQGFSPTKSLGQNFLIDANICDRIVEAAGITPADTVLEVGPGLGTLTERLLDRAAAVVAVEIDARLTELLRARFSARRNLRLIEGDALRVDLGRLLAEGVTLLVANLPYSVGSRVLFALAESPHRPRGMTVTLQREVVERLAAPVGGKAYGLLSVWMQTFYRIRLDRLIPASCFLPPPRVESAVGVLECLPAPRCGEVDLSRYGALLKHAFAHRRKQLGALLRKGPPALRAGPEAFAAAGLSPLARPETLTPEDFGRLLRAMPAPRSGNAPVDHPSPPLDL